MFAWFRGMKFKQGFVIVCNKYKDKTNPDKVIIPKETAKKIYQYVDLVYKQQSDVMKTASDMLEACQYD